MIIIAVGLLALAMGLIGLIQPERFRGWVGFWNTTIRIYLALGLRALLGIVFVFGQYDARFPAVIGTLGWVMIVAALAGVAIGPVRLRALLSWFGRLRPTVLRLWAASAVVVGAAVVVSA